MKAVRNDPELDLAEVLGQESAKRALEVAMAGGHHLLMVGPPGAGKTMLAERVPGLLPPLTAAEAAEVAEIYRRSRTGEAPNPRRPFRLPPPGTTLTGMLGGRRPGEVSLAHQGVLFVDELPLFQRRVLDGLRGPLELGQVRLPGPGLSRILPARFLLVATMNACPCGWRLDDRNPCRCTAGQIARYLRPFAGAVLDRIDLVVSVPHLKLAELRSSAGESSETVARRVAAARAIQTERSGKLNAALDPAGLRAHCRLDAPAQALLDRAVEKLGLSTRTLAGVLKVARTLADLAGSESLRTSHVAEAVQHSEGCWLRRALTIVGPPGSAESSHRPQADEQDLAASRRYARR